MCGLFWLFFITDIKKRGIVCCPFHTLRLLHCLSKSNRQRQSPRRYENSHHNKTCMKHQTTPKGHSRCLQVFDGDIITPWTSTVDYVQDLDTESCKISECLKHSVDKRLNYVKPLYPPWPPCCGVSTPQKARRELRLDID